MKETSIATPSFAIKQRRGGNCKKYFYSCMFKMGGGRVKITSKFLKSGVA
jgi:hypothetical protein